jgi:ATP-dependent RNA helicase SUPV3L1/SUV3
LTVPALGRTVAPPKAGRLPTPDRADQMALQLAERGHRRLVAWRWMALRFPDTYRDIDEAMAESQRLNEWIEAVLAAGPSGRMRAVSSGADTPTRGPGGRRSEWDSAAPEKIFRRSRNGVRSTRSM